MNSTILLVDDNKSFIDIEKEFLKQCDIEVLTAYDGLEAFYVVKTKKPELVFMDLQMPKMDGARCCRAIKSDNNLACTPVVMVTAMGSEEEAAECYTAGCDYFMTKPFTKDHFLKVVRQFLPGFELREKLETISGQASCPI